MQHANSRRDTDVERIHTVVIGAGQAGLAVGYYLARRGIPFVILDAHKRVGDTWRRRWDSLRLFTPARYDALPGLPFPDHRRAFPTKDQMADYLESYAAHFELPVRLGVRVERLERVDDRYVITAGSMRLEASHVIVAMGSFQEPRVPDYAKRLSPSIRQFHSRDYRNPEQLAPGTVLLVGASNSGAEIALDVARSGRVTWLSGRHPGNLPFDVRSPIVQEMILPVLFRFVFHRVFTMSTPMGRKIRAKVLSHGAPLIRVKPWHLDAAGVERVPRVAGVRDGIPVLADGRVANVANVIWCTGYDPGFSWIHLPVFDRNGHVDHRSGIVDREPGLSFVGLNFLHSLSSTMIQGVERDARRIVDAIAA